MDCNGNIYNIGMGCCEPMLGPIENYYTKPATDRKIEEAISGISAVTIDEVQEMIDEAVSGITVSGVTEEELNEAIASAKTQIEAEIPIVPTKVSAFENDVPYLTEHQSLSGYATEQWVEDKHYITGVDLSDYALKSEIPVVPTSNTAFTNDAGYLTEHQSLSGYATEAFVSAFTYDKATIDEKVAGGGSFDPSQYYNKTVTDELLAEKLDVTAYTPVDLSNYYTTGETVNLVESAVTRVEAEIPTIPTSNTAFTNDAGYITGVDLSNYATVDNLTAATDDMATQTWVNNQGYLTEHQSLSAYSTTQEVNTMINQSVSGKQDTLSAGTNITIIDNVISATGGGKVIEAGRGISVTTGATADTVSFNLPITSGSGRNSLVFNDSNNAFGVNAFAEGFHTNAQVDYTHAEGIFTTAGGEGSHTEGQQTRALNRAEHASGCYNVSNKESDNFGDSGNTLFSIGNGTENNARHNAFEIRQNADIYITSGGTDILLQDNLASSSEKTTWNQKQDGLTAGTGVNISGNVISMKIWSGTKAQFDAITVKDNETIYLVTD